MKTKILLIIGVVLLGLVAATLLWKRPAGIETTTSQSGVRPHHAVSFRPLLQPPDTSSEASSPTNLGTATSRAFGIPAFVTTNSTQPSSLVATNRASATTKVPAEDPFARVALAFVGMDAEAEAYWFDAINDPTLPANERKNLIEDLNEDGLSDPKNPGPEDLPVILNRMQLIEELSPYAMDQVNAEAFKEAYKDLLNLANRTIGGGEPVN